MNNSQAQHHNNVIEAATALDVVVVGAGFAGLYALYKLRGMGKKVVVLEKGDGVGGTWFWNCYPGARCDVESLEYSYQFDDELQQEWNWTERYPGQAEILSYLNHVADRYDLRKDIQLQQCVEHVYYDGQSNRWEVLTSQEKRFVANYVILATGALSVPNWPDIKGRDTYSGKIVHTGEWPKEGVDFSGKRVAVIGTGSSGIQVIPSIANSAKSLTVYQRTANFSVPARNRDLNPDEQQETKKHYKELRELAKQLPFGAQLHHSMDVALESSPEKRREVYEERWSEKYGGLHFLGAFQDLVVSTEAGETAAKFIRQKIREIVQDPETAELLCPHNISPGCKRLCSDTNFYETFNLPHVQLIDVSRQPIEEFTRHGIRQGGEEKAFDVVVFATGFDALTGAILRIDVKGEGGCELKAKWDKGPKTYLGISTAKFPNLFFINGPGSPSVLSNMVPSIEHHVEFIAELIEYAEKHEVEKIEATEDAENRWMEHVLDIADQTIYPSCNSWYAGANIPGKPRVFMPYVNVAQYRQECEEIKSRNYEGFELQAT